MSGDTSGGTGWTVVADSETVPRLIDGLLELDPAATYTRSELAEATGVSLKTLHLTDDLATAVELGVLEKHETAEGQVAYSINEDSTVLDRAREFSEAVVAAQSD